MLAVTIRHLVVVDTVVLSHRTDNQEVLVLATEVTEILAAQVLWDTIRAMHHKAAVMVTRGACPLILTHVALHPWAVVAEGECTGILGAVLQAVVVLMAPVLVQVEHTEVLAVDMTDTDLLEVVVVMILLIHHYLNREGKYFLVLTKDVNI